MDISKVIATVDGYVKAAAPYVSGIVSAAEGAVEVIAPEAAAGAAIAGKIITGLLQAEPAAVALYNQIASGTPPTADQLSQYEDSYEAAYAKLQGDIKAKLAELPPA